MHHRLSHQMLQPELTAGKEKEKKEKIRKERSFHVGERRLEMIRPSVHHRRRAMPCLTLMIEMVIRDDRREGRQAGIGARRMGSRLQLR